MTVCEFDSTDMDKVVTFGEGARQQSRHACMADAELSCLDGRESGGTVQGGGGWCGRGRLSDRHIRGDVLRVLDDDPAGAVDTVY